MANRDYSREIATYTSEEINLYLSEMSRLIEKYNFPPYVQIGLMEDVKFWYIKRIQEDVDE
jgi:hypothetical protein